MTDQKPEAKAKAKAEPKSKYDPNGRYVALKPISHASGQFVPAAPGEKPVTFTMKHRSPEEVEYLVDVIKAIKPA